LQEAGAPRYPDAVSSVKIGLLGSAQARDTTAILTFRDNGTPAVLRRRTLTPCVVRVHET